MVTDGDGEKVEQGGGECSVGVRFVFGYATWGRAEEDAAWRARGGGDGRGGEEREEKRFGMLLL